VARRILDFANLTKDLFVSPKVTSL